MLLTEGTKEPSPSFASVRLDATEPTARLAWQTHSWEKDLRRGELEVSTAVDGCDAVEFVGVKLVQGRWYEGAPIGTEPPVRLQVVATPNHLERARRAKEVEIGSCQLAVMAGYPHIVWADERTLMVVDRDGMVRAQANLVPDRKYPPWIWLFLPATAVFDVATAPLQLLLGGASIQAFYAGLD